MSKVVKAINILFAIILVIAAAGIAYVAIPYFGNQALIVRSGSMAPAIDVGSIVVARKNNGQFASPLANPLYKVGDIIAFRSEKNSKTIITHRVTSIEASENGLFYKTKGDGNDNVDSWQVSPGNVLGKVYFTLPYAGRLLAFAKSDIGFPSLIIFPAVFVAIIEFANIIREILKGEALKKSNAFGFTRLESISTKPRFHFGLKVLIPIVIALVLGIPFAIAQYVDTETSASNIFQAAETFPTPTPTGVQPGNVVINEIMWMGTQGDAADEWIELRNMTGSPIDLSNWVITDIGPGAADITIPSGKIIPASGFFIVANDTEPNSVMSVVPDHVVNLSMNDTGEQLILRDASAVTIDTADNSGGGWFAGANPGGQNPKSSMERNSIPGDGTVSTNWHTATTQVNIDIGEGELATPKAANGP